MANNNGAHRQKLFLNKSDCVAKSLKHLKKVLDIFTHSCAETDKLLKNNPGNYCDGRVYNLVKEMKKLLIDTEIFCMKLRKEMQSFPVKGYDRYCCQIDKVLKELKRINEVTVVFTRVHEAHKTSN